MRKPKKPKQIEISPPSAGSPSPTSDILLILQVVVFLVLIISTLLGDVDVAIISQFLKPFVDAILGDFIVRLILETLRPALFLILTFLGVLLLAYSLSKATKFFDSNFSTLLFRRREFRKLTDGKKTGLSKVRDFLLMWFAYSQIALIIVQILFYTFGTQVGNVPILDKSIPVHVFFAFSIIIAISILAEYSKELAKNLLFTLLFGFFTVFLYSAILRPDILVNNTINASYSIGVCAFIFTLLESRIMGLYNEGRDRKHKIWDSIGINSSNKEGQ